MELLLLDTTEKEGEDNKLYHYQQHQQSAASTTTSSQYSWRELRGVLAAAVGTTSSVCGEPLQCAHFRPNASSVPTDKNSTVGDDDAVVGFVNLCEVLYVLVFPPALDVPNAIAQVQTADLSICFVDISLWLNMWLLLWL